MMTDVRGTGAPASHSSPGPPRRGDGSTAAYIRGERSDSDVHRVYDSPENRRRLVRAEDLARRRGTTPGRIALAYVLNQAFPVVGLIGPECVSELTDTLHAADISLDADEVNYLEQGRDEAGEGGADDCLECASTSRLRDDLDHRRVQVDAESAHTVGRSEGGGGRRGRGGRRGGGGS